MTRKRIRRIVILTIVIVFTGYLVWPLSSESVGIQWDETKINSKQEYLSSISTDTTTGPNILLIMVDDLAKSDNTLYDENGPVKTPNINRIADEGVKFNNAYVASPVCSPSRAAVITGRYPQRFGFEHQMHDRYLKNRLEYFSFKYFMNSDPWQPQWQDEVPDRESIELQGLPPSEVTLAEVLRAHGYFTGLIGKWHLGHSEASSPCNMGFDYFYGFHASHSLYAPEGTPGIVDQKIDGDWTDPYIWKGQRNGPHAITEQCRAMEEGEYLTDKIADETIGFIDAHRDEPFFLWASFNAPHTPLQAPEEYVAMYSHEPDPVKRVHYAMIKSLDDAIGRVMTHLTQTGLDSNTLVFFISDNGGAEYNLTTDNGEYKGGKITDFEGGIKVPMAMRWPGTITAGREYDHPVIAMDIFNTSAEAAGCQLPQDRTYDGANLIDALAVDDPPHEYLHWKRGSNHTIRDNVWKLTWSAETGDTLLFNLKLDPYEYENLASANPDVVRRLASAQEAWVEELVPPLWPPVVYYYFEDGGKAYVFEN